MGWGVGGEVCKSVCFLLLSSFLCVFLLFSHDVFSLFISSCYRIVFLLSFHCFALIFFLFRLYRDSFFFFLSLHSPCSVFNISFFSSSLFSVSCLQYFPFAFLLLFLPFLSSIIPSSSCSSFPSSFSSYLLARILFSNQFVDAIQ